MKVFIPSIVGKVNRHLLFGLGGSSRSNVRFCSHECHHVNQISHVNLDLNWHETIKRRHIRTDLPPCVVVSLLKRCSTFKQRLLLHEILHLVMRHSLQAQQSGNQSSELAAICTCVTFFMSLSFYCLDIIEQHIKRHLRYTSNYRTMKTL